MSRQRTLLGCVLACAMALQAFWGPAAGAAVAPELMISAAPDRSGATALAGQTVTGDAYVFVAPASGLRQVSFWLDNPAMSGPARQVEWAAPWDFAGTAASGAAVAFDTSQVADGAHTITALVRRTDNTTSAIQGSFTVANGLAGLAFGASSVSFSATLGGVSTTKTAQLSASTGAASFSVTDDAPWLTVSPAAGTTPATLSLTADPAGLAAGPHSAVVTATAPGHAPATLPVILTVSAAPFQIVASAAADRANPAPLAGATVRGPLYAFTVPESGVSAVRFWVDNTAMSGTPFKIERSAPFDLAGTATDGSAVAFDTTALANGLHTVSARVTLASGGSRSVTASFTVDNTTTPVLSVAPASLTMNGRIDGPAVTAPATVSISPAAGASVSVTSDAAWLQAAPSSGSTPLALEVTADPTGLTAGSYSGALTITSPPLAPVTLPVAFTVTTDRCAPVVCAQILVDLPHRLTWQEDRGGVEDANGYGTGFTYVDRPTNGTGYRPDLVTVLPGSESTPGELRLTTTSGLAFGAANSQANALGVGIDAPNQVTLLETQLLSLPAGTGQYQQAGLWFGNDEDDYVKLVVVSTPTGPRVELMHEEAGVQKRSVTRAVAATGADVTLRLRANPSDRTITGSYILNGGSAVTVSKFTVPGELFSFDAAGIDPEIGTRSFGGIFASHRNGPAPLVYRFSRFEAKAEAGAATAVAPFTRRSYSVPTPTAMVWAPDDRLYVAELFGTIHALTFDASWNVVGDEVITTLGNRLTLGLTVDPASTAADVILWAAHSSPEIYAGEVDSSVVTRLEGPGFATRTDVLTGLPRALADHAVNGIHFGPDGRLYISVGGNTGAGAPNTTNTEFGTRAEQPLSAALLVADVHAPGFDGSCANTADMYGPPPCDVTTYSTGLRNMYDFVLHSNGSIYGADNGLGVAGSFPPSPTAPCSGFASTASYTSGGQNPGPQPDNLLRLEEGRYYGHPNPSRNECVFGNGSYQGVAPLASYAPPLFNLGANRSANGIVEYRGPALCGVVPGDLLIANYSVGDDITRVRLAPDGRSVVSATSLVGGFTDPLPLAQGPGGTLFVGEMGGKVTALVPADSGCWTPRRALPADLLDVAGAALGGKLYAVAGKTEAGGHRTNVYAYDPATDTWATDIPNLPGPGVEDLALAVLDGKLYAFGGGTDPFVGAVTNAAVYDPVTNKWTTLAPMPTARAGATAKSVGAKIYVAGGRGADSGSMATVDVYDPATDTWSPGPSLGTRRDNAGSAVLGGTMYVFGGRTRNADGTTPVGELTTVEMLDLATGTWVPRAPMPTGRRAFGVGTLRGRVQVFGGEVAPNRQAFAANEEYDPVTDTWRALTSMRTPRHGIAAGTIGDVTYAAGGGTVAGSSWSSVHEAFSFGG